MIGRWTLAWLAALGAMSTAVGCFDPSSTTCADGRICPPDSRCDEVEHRCIPAAQELPCVGLAESATCSYANAPGACRGGVCELFYCGDGVVQNLESCDGAPPAGKTCLDFGFDQGFLGCSATCEPAFEGCGAFGWASWPTPPVEPQDFHGVWASGPEDVYAVGTKGIAHWNGAGWTSALSDVPLRGVWGSGPKDVYAVGFTGDSPTGSGGTGVGGQGGQTGTGGAAGTPFDDGVIAHWDGSRWSEVTDPALDKVGLASVWGSGPADVFAVGEGGVVHWDGSRWTRLPAPLDDLGHAFRLSAVWGRGPKDVSAVGEGTIVRWDGSAWNPVMTIRPGLSLNGISGGVDDMFAVGAWASPPGAGAWIHLGVSASVTEGAAEPLNAVWAGRKGEVFAVGAKGTMFDGYDDLLLPSPVVDASGRPPTNPLYGIAGAAGSVFAVGADATVLHWAGSRWSQSPSFLGGLRGLWGTGPNDVYAVGDSINHWDGTGWHMAVPSSSGPSHASLRGPFFGVWGSGPDDVFVVGGSGVIVHWDGNDWTDLASGEPWDIVGVSGVGRSDVFAVGGPLSGNGFLIHWDGAAWSTIWTDADFFPAGVWAIGSDDVYMTDWIGGGIYHWDGTAVSKLDAGTGSLAVTGVWGSGPKDVFAAVEGGTIVHWDGTRWTMTPGASWLTAVVGGSGAGDVFASAASGFVASADSSVLLHLRGGSWEPIRVPGVSVVSGIWATPERVFVASNQGVVYLDRGSVTCVGPERDCHDGWDNDCDGLQDAADPDCAGKIAELCANAIDDDGDGKIDCADSDCAGFPSCRNH